MFTAHETNSTEPKFANSSVNSRIGVHLLRINRALAVLVSLKPVDTIRYGHRKWSKQVRGALICLAEVYCSVTFDFETVAW